MSTTARIISDNLPIDPTIFKGFGTGSQVNFTISGSTGLTNPANLIVSLDGVVQEPNTDYSVNGNIVTFTSAPEQGVKVVIVYRNAPYTTDSIAPTTGSVDSAAIAAGAVIPAKLSVGGPSWDTSGNVTISGNLSSRNLLLQGDNTHGYVLPTNASSNLYLGSSNVNQAVILSNGNFGIGTLSPSTKLTVGSGNILITRSDNNVTNLSIANSWSGALGTWSVSRITLQNTRTSGRTFVIESATDANTNSYSSQFYIGDSTANAGVVSFFPLQSAWDLKENSIFGCPNVLRGFVNFYGGANFDVANAATGNVLTPQTGTKGGTWTIPVNGAPGNGGTAYANNWVEECHLGVEYFINPAGSLNYTSSLGGRLATDQLNWTLDLPYIFTTNRFKQRYAPGIGIRIVEILSPQSVRWEYLDPRLTATNNTVVNGNGTSSGFVHYSCGIKGAYGVNSIGRSSVGKFFIQTTNWFRHPSPTYATDGQRQSSLVVSGMCRYNNTGEDNIVILNYLSRTASSSPVFTGAQNPSQGTIFIRITTTGNTSVDAQLIALMWAIERE